MSDAMRVGIIGTGWGRLHCGTFRQAGCEVTALVGRDAAKAAAVAAAEGVPVGTDQLEALDDCDVVVIASPTDTHIDFLERFKDKFVLCEKPLCGRVPDPDWVARLGASPIYINYTFAFLDSAQVLAQKIQAGHLGKVHRILLQVGVNLPIEKTPTEWFMEVAVHPLSLLLHVFGPFRTEMFTIGKGRANVAVLLSNADQMLDVSLYDHPKEGIHIEMTVIGEEASARLSGGFRVGQDWWFDPLLISGMPYTDGEYRYAEDVWYRANRRAARTFCEVVRGERTHAEGEALGLFGLARAAQMETMLAPLLRDR
ncbi:MAG: Gfo/Idh/MocA family oxidoreductase [Gammaproteobacteria bacterium]